jgi:non-haem Fe2+, alpha-ketoglutarate-dependent halogenase
MPKLLTPTQISGFERDGFVSPIRAMSDSRAGWYRERLEAFEAAYPGDRLKLDQKAHMICPWVDEMIREPAILDAVEDLVGRDILCWGTSLRAKQPDGKTFAGWHQDTAYADVGPIVVIVALALSQAGSENGCIRAVPGSHRGKLFPHKEAFRTDSILSREQYIDAPVDEAAAVDLALNPGEIALFNNAIIHSFIKAQFRPRPPHHLLARDGADDGLSGIPARIGDAGSRRRCVRPFRRGSAAAEGDGAG